MYIVSVTEDDIQEVWEYWLATHGSGRGRMASLNPSRRRAITNGIESYGVEKCKKAIYGCSLSEFHMGSNTAGKKYNSIELIFRDEWRVNKFAKMADDHEQ